MDRLVAAHQLGGDLMNTLVEYFYSDGDLYMMMAKVFSYMIILLVLACVLGCIRGLRM